jgi:hypothetical protein
MDLNLPQNTNERTEVAITIAAAAALQMDIRLLSRIAACVEKRYGQII